MPEIVTFDQNALESACATLAATVHASGFNYDIAVAIASGGVFVAGCFPDTKFFTVEQRRKSTGMKKQYLRSVLQRLPRRINDFLRIVESRMSALKARMVRPRIVETPLPEDLTVFLSENPRASVLVIDDAVDSGATLLSVMTAISHAAPGALVEAAVITVTRRRPLVSPRFALYRNNTLIRFPWSNDS